MVAAFGCTLGIVPHMAAAIRDHVISRPRVLTWMRGTFAVALGAKLAFAER